MMFSKKYPYIILRTALIVGVVAVFFSACSPAIGTPWYPRSVATISKGFIVTGIQVKGLDVVPVLAETPTDDVDKIKKFSGAKTYTVNVPPEITEITAEDITITAVGSLSAMEPILVEVRVNGDSVPLSAGRIVPVTIKIADAAGECAVQEKVLSITQSEPYDLRLTRSSLSMERYRGISGFHIRFLPLAQKISPQSSTMVLIRMWLSQWNWRDFL